MKAFLVLSAVVIFALAVEAVNFKKDYCKNQDYVGNPGSRYPHLHCGKSFLTLSRSKSQHDNLEGRCNKVAELLSDPRFFYAGIKEITVVLQAYRKDGCRLRREALYRLLKLNNA